MSFLLNFKALNKILSQMINEKTIYVGVSFNLILHYLSIITTYYLKNSKYLCLFEEV